MTSVGDQQTFRDRQGDRFVLCLIGGGIVVIILSIIATIAFGFEEPPTWAESVFSAIVGGALVKLADVLSALVSLSSSRQMERVTDQLSTSAPPDRGGSGNVGPSGTEKDPLHVAGAGSGEPPVRTEDA